MKHIISTRDLSKEDILFYLKIAESIEKKEFIPDLSDKIVLLIFFEPSTRTSFSFETAIKKLKGNSLNMTGLTGSSIEKGETFHDTLKVLGSYGDLLVIRSPYEGTARFASEILSIPVINAGDGSNQHPTQALIDLYSIQKTQNTLENLTIAVVGDLKFGRTVHSLVYAMSHFNPLFYFISPMHLRIPTYITDDLSERKIRFEERRDIESVLPELDIMYITRVQKERFADPEEYEKVKNSYIIGNTHFQKAKDNMKVLHPLPRVSEIKKEVDDSPFAYYFEQARNGIAVRQAILYLLFKVD